MNPLLDFFLFVAGCALVLGVVALVSFVGNRISRGDTSARRELKQTKKELAIGSSPAAMEEAARKSGFARPGEQVYVIVKPSDAATAATGGSASPAAAPSPRQSVSKQDGGGVIGRIENWWRSLWH